MAKKQTKVLLPRSSGKYNFVLTPLADAMFQLLIFFMLSSNLAPYSLLTIRSGAGAAEAADTTGEQPSDQIAQPPANAAIWTVTDGEIIAGGQRFGADNLAPLAEALAAQPDAAVVLILRTEARVQDLSSVLEALTAAGVQQVQIAEGGDV